MIVIVLAGGRRNLLWRQAYRRPLRPKTVEQTVRPQKEVHVDHRHGSARRRQRLVDGAGRIGGAAVDDLLHLRALKQAAVEHA